jgi:hypothetical protein
MEWISSLGFDEANPATAVPCAALNRIRLPSYPKHFIAEKFLERKKWKSS